MISILNRLTLLLPCRKLSSPRKLILRRISFLEKIKKKPALLNKTNHKVIYEFKYILFPAVILKMKFLLPVISVPFISACFYFNEPKLTALILITCFTQSILLILASRLFKNTIGKIYVNKEGDIDNVIISSIDFNGNRVDNSFSPDQFALSEQALINYLGFLKVTAKDPNKDYIINFRNVSLCDKRALSNIFGDSSYFIIDKKK